MVPPFTASCTELAYCAFSCIPTSRLSDSQHQTWHLMSIQNTKRQRCLCFPPQSERVWSHALTPASPHQETHYTSIIQARQNAGYVYQPHCLLAESWELLASCEQLQCQTKLSSHIRGATCREWLVQSSKGRK